MIHSDWHIHSEYSYDAQNPLSLIGTNTAAQGLRFAGITDHANFNDTKFLGDLRASVEGVKEAQKTFFEYHAMRYRAEYTPLQFQHMLGDVHSVNMVRVNGMVQHMDSWYELYNVQEGDALYLPADKRIKIW